MLSYILSTSLRTSRAAASAVVFLSEFHASSIPRLFDVLDRLREEAAVFWEYSLSPTFMSLSIEYFATVIKTSNWESYLIGQTYLQNRSTNQNTDLTLSVHFPAVLSH